jgi:hypothetical protein
VKTTRNKPATIEADVNSFANPRRRSDQPPGEGQGLQLDVGQVSDRHHCDGMDVAWRDRGFRLDSSLGILVMAVDRQ